MSHYACKISPSLGAWYRCRFLFGASDGFSCTFHFCLSLLVFWTGRVSKKTNNRPLSAMVESLSGSVLLRHTELRELKLDEC